MVIRVGIENNIDGRSQAWMLDHPGCFAYGEDSAGALGAVPEAVHEYAAWIASHTEESWLSAGVVEVHLEETFEVYRIDQDFNLAEEGYQVESFFRHDWKPLTADEIDRLRKLLAWSRADLLGITQNLNPEKLELRYPGERWSIAGILNHVGGAEWWYMDRLGLAFPRQEVPEGPFERLAQVRLRLEEILPSLESRQQVVGLDGELWSPRKVLRRASWHERDHYFHIQKLLSL